MLLIKIKTFIKSLFFHVWLGLPKSTQSEINYRFSICNSCEKFNPKKQECGVCGCSINTKRIFLNKLAWADQECPEKKWPKIQR
jgi:uncharacterized paraquat-inducible protein A